MRKERTISHPLPPVVRGTSLRQGCGVAGREPRGKDRVTRVCWVHWVHRVQRKKHRIRVVNTKRETWIWILMGRLKAPQEKQGNKISSLIFFPCFSCSIPDLSGLPLGEPLSVRIWRTYTCWMGVALLCDLCGSSERTRTGVIIYFSLESSTNYQNSKFPRVKTPKPKGICFGRHFLAPRAERS